MINTIQLQQACSDILYKNMEYRDQTIYLLYDTESPLAQILSNAWISVLEKIEKEQNPSSSLRYNSLLEVRTQSSYQGGNICIREFENPPQPLYRGGLINPDNPHLVEQNRIITTHNINENKRVGLDHHEVHRTTLANDSKDRSRIVDPSGESEKITETNSQGVQDIQIEDIKNALISLPS